MPESSSTTLIAPAGPALDGLSTLPIDNLDVFGYIAANSYIVPEIIDVERFKDALSKTLVLFPLYAARSKNPSASSPPLSPRKVVLDPSAPLAAILLTTFPALGVTSIGITRWHPIGSDYVASRFIRALSRFYEGVEMDVLGEPKPVYEAARAFLPTPDPKLLEGIDTSAVEAYYPATSPHPQLDPSQPENIRLDFRLSAPQVHQLHAAIHGLGGPNASFLTKQDCLVALVAVATNTADPSVPPIHTIDTILDVRGAAAVPSELSFNGFTFAPTDRIAPTGENDYYAYASAVRKSIMRAREPGFLSALVDLQSAKAAEATNRGEIMDLASNPGHMMCNSTLRLDSNMRPHIHFGHPGKTRSYVGTVPFLRHLKLARPNPVENADGTWTERLDVTEVTLYFQPEVRDRFKRGG
ncbi:hypothetical protein MVEN_01620300 [Mycena venus]|uniref:Uncharacterized protein n=1 Tax=Mycena venus TaxID=2733690 RepID=A0A8H6XRQ8_9AGAR|nr:hypothetical protein MVEN_01620300 [Mycena venus]